MKIRLASKLQQDSIVDGPGIRMVIWTQGCSHNCKGCHNPKTHDFNEGFLKEIDELKMEIKSIKNHDGITLSGGDPFFQIESCLEIAKFSKEIGLNVWCYTGFTFEEILKLSKVNKKALEFLTYIDVLIDGKFILEQKDLTLQFRGSKNQRIINVKSSLKNGKAVMLKRFNKSIKNREKKERLFV